MKHKWLLIVITVLGLLLRTIKLDSRPLGFTWDEAAIGYNAYSLVKTGRDEFGMITPLVFKSFGDFKPGLYIYFSALPIKILGLNEFATRLPSAIFGTLLILAVYLLSKSIFASTITAFNPWLIHFSRGAWEANLCLLLTVLGMVCLQRKKLILAAVLLGLTFITYQGAKLFTPLILLSWIFIYRPNLKKLILPGLVIFGFLVPILFGITTQSGRLNVYSVFSYTRSVETVAEIKRQDPPNLRNLYFNLFHLELIDQSRGVLQRYFNYFSPKYLFFAGDWTSLRHSTPYIGYFYLPEIICLILGLTYLVKHFNKFSALVFIWALLAPIPAALSRDLVSGVRSLPLSIPLIMIMGVGLSQIWRRKLIIIPYLIIYIFFFAYFIDLYLIHSPQFTGVDWLTAYKPAMQIVNQKQSEVSDVYITNKFGQPYIFVLFYTAYDPATYQKRSQFIANSNGDVGEVTGFGKYHFQPIFWPSLKDQKSALIIGGEYELPVNDTQPFATIYYPNGKIALKCVTTN